jgi:c-di-GMP-related signal transduction protein
MDIPMVQVVESLSLTAELTEALVNRKGKLGLVLTVVIAAEGGNWDKVSQFGFGPEVWQNIYFESVKWSNVIMNEVHTV